MLSVLHSSVFANVMYVFDDEPILVYNHLHGTKTIWLDEIESVLSSDFYEVCYHVLGPENRRKARPT